ncbi:MAG: ABC transporter permease, partial [Gemmatimonadales bacterium]
MRWSRLLFRILLLAHPGRIRQERGADMWLTFEHHLRDARRVGRFAVLDLWRRELIALWRGSRRARISARERRRADRRPVGSERAKSFMAFGMSWLDFKLGFRMLIKYPGLTLVGGFAMSVGIAIAAGSFEFLNDFINPTLPLEEGDRVVAIQNWDATASSTEFRSLHDFLTWRDELESVEDIGAYTTFRRNVITEDGRAEPVRGSKISASAFRLVRVPPLMGRPLVETDEQDGAPPVVVIGHDLWQARFGGDSGVMGRSVQLGNSRSTVVGVMP